ncbi:MAG: hypothetical protein HGA90_02925 [Alphaproteobacteria bacterium]|nr:hypothetical protein [Alphaproteobacteria bacterium]
MLATSDNLKSIRDLSFLNHYPDHAENALIIRDVTAVGAEYTLQKGLSPRDLYWLASSMECCIDQGFAVEKDFRLNTVSLFHNEDFLNPEFAMPPTDLLVICFIPDPQNKFDRDELRSISENARIKYPNDIAAQYAHRLSDHHFAPDAWAKAAHKSGAKVITTFLSYPLTMEIDRECLKGKSYKDGICYTIEAPSLSWSDDFSTYYGESLVKRDIARKIRANACAI